MCKKARTKVKEKWIFENRVELHTAFNQQSVRCFKLSQSLISIVLNNEQEKNEIINNQN